MFVLLSSAYSPRYREDILRCLAAPIGSEVQFRYDKKWVAENILEKMKKGTMIAGAPAIVCWVDTQGNGPLRMIPVRSVSISKFNLHGRTLSLTLKMSDVQYAEPTSFTNEVFSLSGDASPHSKNGKVEGKYFFEIPTLPPSLQTGRTVALWEELVALLQQEQPFQAEQFFWVTVGIAGADAKVDTEFLSEWPTAPVSGPFDLLVYHYQPKQAPAVQSKLSVRTSSGLTSDRPAEVAIDSRYDLKRWRLEAVPDQYKIRQGWIRIRTNDTWDLDLGLIVKSSLRSAIARSIVAGTLIAVPAVLAIITQKDLSLSTQAVMLIVSLIAGVLGAAAVVFGFDVFS